MYLDPDQSRIRYREQGTSWFHRRDHDRRAQTFASRQRLAPASSGTSLDVGLDSGRPNNGRPNILCNVEPYLVQESGTAELVLDSGFWADTKK